MSSDRKRNREGYLGPHPIRNPDGSVNVKKELAAIKKEKKRLFSPKRQKSKPG